MSVIEVAYQHHTTHEVERMIISRLAGYMKSIGVERLLKSLACVATVVGIIFAGMQLKTSTEIDRRQTTLNILKPTREEAVLSALQRMRVATEFNKPLEEILTERVTIDRNLILNTYDSVAIHYQFDNLEKCVVKAHVREALDLVIETLIYLNVPDNSSTRITQLRVDLDALKCTKN
jgi:hypothetical protein